MNRDKWQRSVEAGESLGLIEHENKNIEKVKKPAVGRDIWGAGVKIPSLQW